MRFFFRQIFYNLSGYPLKLLSFPGANLTGCINNFNFKIYFRIKLKNMKSLIILLFLCTALSFFSVAQQRSQMSLPQRSWHELIIGDTVVLFIGVQNKFSLTSGEIVEPEKEIKGITAKNTTGDLVLLPKYPGVFTSVFNTPSGRKKVIMLSKPISLEELKKGN